MLMQYVLFRLPGCVEHGIPGTYASIMPVALLSDSQVLETSAGLLNYDS